MYKSKLVKYLSKVTGLDQEKIKVDVPERMEFGDYSTNIALELFSKSNQDGLKSPRELAEKVVKKLKSEEDVKDFIQKIEIAGPGFINFWLSKNALLSSLGQVVEHKDNFGKTDLMKGSKVMIEFGDANTHKLPHIGHLYSYSYGEAVSRILSFVGAETRKVCYQGDVGLHVAKCLWAFKKENPDVPESLDDKVQLLQEMYQKGSRAYDESEESKKEIMQLNKNIYEMDRSIVNLWKETRVWNINYYKHFEADLGISYDRYYYESEVYKNGQQIVEDNIGKVFTKSKGAIIFKGSKYNLHDRVFITNYNTPTYEAKDMYLQKLKFQEFPMDLCIIATANEQDGYFDVVFKALEILDPKYKGKLKHLGFGMINLKSGKMSSRTGEIIGALEVIDKVKSLSAELNPDPEISKIVAVAAIKYSFLKNNYLQNLIFDIDESVAREGNSGPYLQYTYARTRSVIGKSNEKPASQKYDADFSDSESELLRLFVHFPEVVENAAKTYSPNLICNYLFNLAQVFNKFYNNQRIIGSVNEDFRLTLTFSVGQIIKNGLYLLGIEAPEKM